MDLGTRTSSTAALLLRVGERIRSREALLVEEWEDITAWASEHVVAGPEGVATITEGYLDTGVPIAGDGAPLVSEFALMGLIAVLGRSPDGGRAYVGRVIECAWRLPQVYDSVMAGKLAPWRAERIADLTRHDLALDLLVPDPDTGEVVDTVPGRKVVLNVHITDTTLADRNPVGRWEEGRCPITSAQIREWLRARHTTVIVRPVIDLADHVPVGSYEIPERHKTRVALRDHTCRFPHCTRPAQACDLDHARPHADCGPTCRCNLASCK